MEIHGIDQYMEYMERRFGLQRTPEADCVRYTLPPELGDGSFELYHSPGRYQVWITHATLRQDVDMSYTQDQNTYIGLSYVETEEPREESGKERPEAIHDWRTARSLPSDGAIYGVCRAGRPLRAVTLLLFPDFFLSGPGSGNPEDDFDLLKTIRSFDEQSFMSGLYPVLAELLHCPFKGAARSLFMKSRVYDAAARLISLCDTECAPPNISLSRLDEEQIRRIPHILREHMKNPPSISGLSRMVTLNEFKLKAGFKKVFNATVYEQLRQLRTERAIELMKGELTLEQISEQIGYKSLRGFSQAFAKCAGATPAEWRKQRRTSPI